MRDSTRLTYSKINFLCFIFIVHMILSTIHSLKTDSKNIEIYDKSKKIKSMILKSKSSIENKIAIFEKNSCLKSAIKSLENDCEMLSDNEKSTFAFLMTECIYNNLRRNLDIDCEYKDYRCCKYLHGDSWTTYLNSLSSIENYCLYFKINDWEEQLTKNIKNLIDNSIMAIEMIELSKNTFHQIIKKQELFSSISQKYFSNTMSHLKNISETSSNYKEFENGLKQSFIEIENQVKKSNSEIKNLYSFIDDKIDLIQSINYVFSTMTKYSQYSYMKNFYVYFFLFVLSLYFFNINLFGFRFYFLVELILYYICEFHLNLIVEGRFNNELNNSEIVFLDAGINLFFTSLRILFCFISLISFLIYYYLQGRFNNKDDLNGKLKSEIKNISSDSKHYSDNVIYLDNKITKSINEIKSGIMKTPEWINKFFSRIDYSLKESLPKPNLPCNKVINNNSVTNYSFRKEQYGYDLTIRKNQNSDYKNRNLMKENVTLNYNNQKNKYHSNRNYNFLNNHLITNNTAEIFNNENSNSINLQNISEISSNQKNKNINLINDNETRKKLNFQSYKNSNCKLKTNNENFSTNLA